MPVLLTDNCRQLLEAQHGVIARWQVAASELDQAAIKGQLQCGRWRQLYRGVYAAYTGDPARECLLWGAVLRAGPGAPPVVIHRPDRIDQARHPARNPPRTRVEETIVDLTQLAAGFEAVFGWLSAGCGRRLVTPQQLQIAIGKRQRVRWRSEILGALDRIAEGVHSNPEYRYVRDVERAHRLPAPRRQARVLRQGRSQYFDNLYEEYGVAVELDGRAAHSAEDRWRDQHRDNRDARSGIITLRYNWADVTIRRCEVAAEVAAILQLHGWNGQPAGCSAGPAAAR